MHTSTYISAHASDVPRAAQITYAYPDNIDIPKKKTKLVLCLDQKKKVCETLYKGKGMQPFGMLGRPNAERATTEFRWKH